MERSGFTSFWLDPARTWEDAVKYGSVSGGGGKWYSQSLNALEPGHRVFVNVPKRGFVGVGSVLDTVVPVKDFRVEVGGQSVPILEAPLDAPAMGENATDPNTSEYVDPRKWLKTVPVSEVVSGTVGMFANQNMACRLQGEKGEFTIARVSELFGLDDAA